jgi:hypothetical protein
VIYPSIPGELDLPLLVEAAHTAREGRQGIWADQLTLLAYEYRAVEKLYRITERLVAGQAPFPPTGTPGVHPARSPAGLGADRRQEAHVGLDGRESDERAVLT